MVLQLGTLASNIHQIVAGNAVKGLFSCYIGPLVMLEIMLIS